METSMGRAGEEAPTGSTALRQERQEAQRQHADHARSQCFAQSARQEGSTPGGSTGGHLSFQEVARSGQGGCPGRWKQRARKASRGAHRSGTGRNEATRSRVCRSPARRGEAARRDAAMARTPNALPLSLSTARGSGCGGAAIRTPTGRVRRSLGRARSSSTRRSKRCAHLAKRPHTPPMVTVAIRSDGSVESVTFVTPSGSAEVDGIRAHGGKPPTLSVLPCPRWRATSTSSRSAAAGTSAMRWAAVNDAPAVQIPFGLSLSKPQRARPMGLRRAPG